MEMTPTFRWVFLLAMVGRAASVPRPLVVDACALLCNPGAEMPETESERERDPVLFPRYPKVNCKLETTSDQHQAWIIASTCLKLCSYKLTIPLEVNCFALRSSLQANLGCYCEALTPLSPNTMRLHESWRLEFLVKELASDILTVILKSELDTFILCEIHNEVFKTEIAERTFRGTGNMIKECITKKDNVTSTLDEGGRSKREIDHELEWKPEKWKEVMEPTVQTVAEETEPETMDSKKQDEKKCFEQQIKEKLKFLQSDKTDEQHSSMDPQSSKDSDSEQAIREADRWCESVCKLECKGVKKSLRCKCEESYKH